MMIECHRLVVGAQVVVGGCVQRHWCCNVGPRVGLVAFYQLVNESAWTESVVMQLVNTFKWLCRLEVLVC